MDDVDGEGSYRRKSSRSQQGFRDVDGEKGYRTKSSRSQQDLGTL